MKSFLSIALIFASSSSFASYTGSCPNVSDIYAAAIGKANAVLAQKQINVQFAVGQKIQQIQFSPLTVEKNTPSCADMAGLPFTKGKTDCHFRGEALNSKISCDTRILSCDPKTVEAKCTVDIRL